MRIYVKLIVRFKLKLFQISVIYNMSNIVHHVFDFISAELCFPEYLST